MPPPPQNPRIYHIVHVENLASIVHEGCLYSDAQIRHRGLAVRGIGYTHIKERRLFRPVPVAAGGRLGEYVPFNFCPRSVMLYVVGRGHDGYGEGQSPVVHLVSSFARAVAVGQPWAFTDRHAELQHALYFDNATDLDQVDWQVMPLEQWGGQPEIKERRQAEFLVHDHFPWSAIEAIGTCDARVAAQVNAILVTAPHAPPVAIDRSWYYP